jgi:hypothetical protein
MGASVIAWHFLPDDGKTQHDTPRIPVHVGQTLTVASPLKLCERGLHASVRALDALQYASGSLLCRVRLDHTILHDDDKLAASSRTVLAMADASMVLHEFACWNAEAALFGLAWKGEEIDLRSLAAIDTKRRWMRGEASDSELAAARAAARAAATAAAMDAAWDAAMDAANTRLETAFFHLLNLESDHA